MNNTTIFRGLRRLSFYNFLALTIITVSTGCQSQTVDPIQPPATESGQTTGQASGQISGQETIGKIKFKQGNGDEKFSLKLKPNGAKLVDNSDNELARLTTDNNQKIKIKDAADQVLGYVVTQENYWKVENAEQTEELYILRRQKDGDYKLEEGNDSPVYRIKVRDYGYEIETPDKTSLYKVKLKAGKLSLRNATGDTVLSTKSPMSTIAIASFGFDVLTPPQQAALAYALNLEGGQ